MRGGHECVVWDMSADELKNSPAKARPAATSLDDFIAKLETPRAVWIMVPAGEATEKTVNDLGRPSRSPATSSSTAATRILKMTCAGPKALTDKGIQLRRCRHERRRVGTRTWLLHDDRRPERSRRRISIRFSKR